MIYSGMWAKVGVLATSGALLLAACGPQSSTALPSEAAAQAASDRTAPPSDKAPDTGAVKESEVEVKTQPEDSSLKFSKAGWRTDFTKHSVPLADIFGGGPPKDGIAPIDDPKFLTVSEASDWYGDPEPVGYLNLGDEAKAYPLQILIWHEIVNDTVGGHPVTMTFCPLCNTVLAFDRRLGDRLLDFGTSGNLRFSDLVMYDRQTESWWQQVTGEAIVGELTGNTLEALPTGVISWGEFKAAFPEGKVLSRETGFGRDYGRNPYGGYDKIDNTPFLFFGAPDARVPAMERVVAVSINNEDVAYPFTYLSSQGVINDTVGGEPIVVFHKFGTTSALDSSLFSDSRDVGAGVVFSPVVDGKKLTFKSMDGKIVDVDTGSTWSITGKAEAGSLAGTALTPVVHGNHFWFAWAAFKPDTQVREP